MPKQLIGRFEILKELGKGGQGPVYLAYDPKLDRQVAIKTLHMLDYQSEQLIHEARIVSKLLYPNIIPLYDSGEHHGTPYLVYAYVEGRTLAQLLKEQNILPLAKAAEIACGVLEALACAHAQGVFHLDIKPANIMISASGIPMVMDFGLAATSVNLERSHSFNGTPRYMAPEIISGKNGDALSDIYSLGTVLYEMVTGQCTVSDNDVLGVLYFVKQENIISPSMINDQIDESFESIILKALAIQPKDRYLSAQAMKQVLQSYLGEIQEFPFIHGNEHSTLEFLMRRMRSKKDFPAISNIISEINQIVSSESGSSSKLARTILQDFALTNKLLKLVNTANYGHFGGTINTVSKAVVILGFETVRSIASSLILMEFMQNKSQSMQLKDEVIRAIFAGMVAAQLSVGHNIRDAEEIMVCSMFHNLGKMLAIFYFFDENQEISRLIEQGESEDKAAVKILGITYTDLGLGVARNWNFPPRLIAGMRKLAPGKLQSIHGDIEYLTVTVNLAHELCEISSSTDPMEKSQQLRELIKRYEIVNPVTEQELAGALDFGLSELARRSGVLGIATAKSPLLNRVRIWNSKSHEAQIAKNADELEGITQLDHTATEINEGIFPGTRPTNTEALLGAGIQDVTTSLVSDYRLNDILQMILETMYRGMGFSRALILTRDNSRNAMVARFGFGAGVESVIPRFYFPVTFVPDVFHLAIVKGLDIAIEDTHAPNINDKIPAWYRKVINAPCFVLLPVMLKDKAVGLFYADMPKINSLGMSQQQLSLLRTLRNQAVLAIKQKS